VIVQAVVQLIKGVGCEIVAEAVENSAQADILRTMGCDTVQGFAFGEPIFEPQYRALISHASGAARGSAA
jgi:EAL domain-containing protein (putative c-di-GMP-specific phosphodiesterase class I)